MEAGGTEVEGQRMTEWQQIVLTACATVLVGVITLVVGEIIKGFFIHPIIELRKLIGEIADTLGYYANVYGNPGCIQDELVNEASKALREKAGQLEARCSTIAWYNLWHFLGLVPSRRAVHASYSKLVFLSNQTKQGDALKNHEAAQSIRRALKISVLPE